METYKDKIVSFVPINEIEPEALTQLENTASVPFLFKHVAVMPDCHFGMGSTVGTVIATKGAIIPSAVGVDIGCGMIAVKTNLKREDIKDLEALRHSIERSIPVSFGQYNKTITESAQKRIDELEAMAGEKNYSSIDKNWKNQLGTLGSGNHFIEISLDENDTIWAVLHSGSRGIGNKIAQKHIKIAKDFMKKWFIELKDPDLAYLPINIPQFGDYIEDLHWAQKFALLNREEMMDRVMKDISYAVFGEDGHQSEIELERINCHHNFTQQENHFHEDVWVTRKGAIQMRLGQKGFIPGSMGTRSYVVEGKENPMSFHSAPHGAGRRMSRNEAKKRFTMEDFDRELEGVEVKHDKAFIDEIPSAYKDIDQVIEYAKPLVDIKYTLKQILNVKGN